MTDLIERCATCNEPYPSCPYMPPPPATERGTSEMSTDTTLATATAVAIDEAVAYTDAAIARMAATPSPPAAVDTTATPDTAPTDTDATAAEVSPEEISKTKANDFRQRSRVMQRTTREARLAKYPNPKTMNIRQLLADCRREQAERGWCSEAQQLVGELRVGGPNGQRHQLLSQYPQWNPDINGYDSWAVNPQLPADLTEISTALVIRLMDKILRSHGRDNGYQLGMENILSAQFVTHEDIRTSVKVTFDHTFTPEDLDRYGYVVDETTRQGDLLTYVRRMLSGALDRYSGSRVLQDAMQVSVTSAATSAPTE